MEILRECGYLPTGYGFGVVDLCNIPDGPNAKELDLYLRERGAQLCPYAIQHDSIFPTPEAKKSPRS